ncbi:hypothetical protein Pan181_49500 [Aeoliella mucimassa]|uniref:Uncharacterized protein n=1 Tax=Aeoliella mucimassa TaxID=2527972 RepID=A0A518AVG0_9BACT|nr:hypothetical protein Pan181_49500 [Aeoliella mucimassa]
MLKKSCNLVAFFGMNVVGEIPRFRLFAFVMLISGEPIRALFDQNLFATTYHHR